MGRHRPALEVQRRGDWASDKSLKRYGKETRLLSEINKIPESTLNFGRQVKEHLEEFSGNHS